MKEAALAARKHLPELTDEKIGKLLAIKWGPQGQITADSLATFLYHFRRTGNAGVAALAANLSLSAIDKLRSSDSDFAGMYEHAHALFTGEVLERAALEQAVTGIYQPMLDKAGNVVAYKREMAPRLLELMLKRHDKNYRDNHQTVEHQHSGGVMLIPIGSKQNEQEWEKKWTQYDAKHDADPNVIDAEARPVEEAAPQAAEGLPPGSIDERSMEGIVDPLEEVLAKMDNRE